MLADNSDDTKVTKLLYKDGLALSASQTATALSALTFSATTYQGCMIEYRMKDSSTGVSRIGMLLISTDGTNTSISDSFAETDPIGVSWSAGIADTSVEIRYTTNSTAKVMSAKVKLFE